MDVSRQELRKLAETAVDALGETRASTLDELYLSCEYQLAIEEKKADHRRELPDHVDPHDLSQTGWGVIFVQDEDPAIKRELEDFLELREEQAGSLYQELVYTPGDSGRTFLWNRHGETPGVLDPEVLPYYLLLVGDPEKIPFEVQYQLGINHAVGRLHFEDVADYGRYARAVVAADEVEATRRAVLFSVENGDWVTDLLARHLVQPLEQSWAEVVPGDWKIESLRGEKASKGALQGLLGGAEKPNLLLVSCHGLEVAAGQEDQETRQGALLCHGGEPFDFEDLADDACLEGQIVFCFACYGAGTPVQDNFPHATEEGEPVRQVRTIAERPFLARLPTTLLSRGALAVLGHVDRGWTLSFAWVLKNGEATATRSLEEALRQLIGGERLGHALRPLHRRYQALASFLVHELQLHEMDPQIAADPDFRKQLAVQWIAHNDARNFIVLGDPAVYLPGRSDVGES